MKRFSIIFIAAAALTGCAVEKAEDTGEAAVFEFESWMQVHYPEVFADESMKTPLGAYILPGENDGSGDNAEGDALDKADYIRVQYVARTLQGQVTSSSDSTSARQFGTYDTTYYYGPKIWQLSGLNVGVKDMLKGMKKGERRTAAIPGWLMTSKEYPSEKEYRANVTGNSHAIYTVVLDDIIPEATKKDGNDLAEWQTKVIEGYLDKYDGKAYPNQLFDDKWTIDAESMKDTSSVEKSGRGPRGSVYGFYFDNGKDFPTGEDSVAFEKKDTTLLINYTGRRIITMPDKDGNLVYDEQVFDTTDEQVAKRANIYDPSKSYEPVKITWGESAIEIKMGSGSVISGFSKMLWNMQFHHKQWEKYETGHKGETSPQRKAIAVFYSDYGYQANGSGSLIPGYCPLMFEVEIIKEEKIEEK